MIHDVATSYGLARIHVSPATEPVATLVLGTGASGSVEAVDLSLMPRQLPGRGITVVRVEQPWHVAGGKMPSRPPVLDGGWREVLDVLRTRADLAPLGVADHPVVVGGRSNGARVACRTAVDEGIAGVVCYAFPLHQPGRPDQTRLPELLTPELSQVDRPRLVLQGERDAFATAAQLRDELGEGHPSVEVVTVPWADHSMRVAKSAPVTATDVAVLLIERSAAFVRAVATGASDAG